MMQKSISVKTLPDSQKNMVVLGVVPLGRQRRTGWDEARRARVRTAVHLAFTALFMALVAVAAPLLCWAIDLNQRALFGRWQLGLELLVLNGALTFAGLWLVSRPAPVAVNARAATR